MYSYYNPVRVYEGAGCVDQLPHLVRELAAQKVLLLVWDKGVLQRQAIRKIRREANETEFITLCFDASNPEVDQLFALYEQTREMKIDLVVAIGGGSVLDVGKSLCCLYGDNILSVDDLRGKIKAQSLSEPSCHWIGVPTTAGTGSEVTCWATIWDSKMNAKLSLERQDNYAYAALVDPQFAATMPVKLAVSSALDAVAHATESYWAKASNPVSSALALAAVERMMANIEILVREPKNLSVHEAMAVGSMLAGMAFSNTKTTACHSISYPLTMRYHIPHGTAVSMLLVPVLRLNVGGFADSCRLLRAFGTEGVDQLEQKIKGILKRVGIPNTLRAWGAEREELPEIARLGLTKGRADNNPVQLTEETVLTLLEEIYE